MLDLGQHGEVVRVDEDVSAILERRQKIERLVQPVGDASRRLRWRGLHALERSVTAAS